MPDWKKVKAEYIRGGTSYRKLAEKFGVSFSSVKRHAVAEKWTDLRSKSEEKATSKMIEKVAGQEAKRVEAIDTIADKILQQISDGLDDGSIQALGRGWRDITGALKDIRDIKGLKSDLDMKEQLARIEKLRREAQTEEANKDIRVVIESSLDKYSK